jgi:predicted small lipoprotein YifL
MPAHPPAMRAALLIALLSTATACGQTGSLYLPDEAIESPVEIRTTVPAPAAPAAEEEEKEEKATQPPGR